MDIRYLNNVMNEVVNGFTVDYPKSLGASCNEAAQLLERIHPLAKRRAPNQDWQLSTREASLVLKASELCLEEIEEPEFGTRLGVSATEAMEMNRELSSYIESGRWDDSSDS